MCIRFVFVCNSVTSTYKNEPDTQNTYTKYNNSWITPNYVSCGVSQKTSTVGTSR